MSEAVIIPPTAGLYFALSLRQAERALGSSRAAESVGMRDVLSAIRSACEDRGADGADARRFIAEAWLPRSGAQPAADALAGDAAAAVAGAPADASTVLLGATLLRCLPAGQAADALAATLSDRVAELRGVSFDLVREVARGMAASRTRYSDGSWTPRCAREEDCQRARVAAFVGTVDGLSPGAPGGAAARRLAADFFWLACAVCGCEPTALVLTALSAASACSAMSPGSARAAAACVALGWAAAERHCWGAFGGDTADFTRSVAVDDNGDDGDDEAGEDGGGAARPAPRPFRRRAPDPAEMSRSRGGRVLAGGGEGEAQWKWLCLVHSVVRRSVGMAIEALGGPGGGGARAAALGAAMAARGMEATADLADRVRSGCWCDKWMGARLRDLCLGVGELARAAASGIAASRSPAKERDEDEEAAAWAETAKMASEHCANCDQELRRRLLAVGDCGSGVSCVCRLGRRWPSWAAFVPACSSRAPPALWTLLASGSDEETALVWGKGIAADSVAAALAIDCALWAAVVSMDGQIQPLRKKKSDDDEEEEESDDDDGDDAVAWQWDGRGVVRRNEPIEAALACARAAKPKLGDAAAKKFAAALLGSGADADDATASWLEGLAGSQRLLEALHAGAASAGPDGAMAMLTGGDVGPAWAWVLGACGWSGAARAIGVDREAERELARRMGATARDALPAAEGEEDRDSIIGAIWSAVRAVAEAPPPPRVGDAGIKIVVDVEAGGGGAGSAADKAAAALDRRALAAQRMADAFVPRAQRRAPRAPPPEFLIDFAAAASQLGCAFPSCSGARGSPAHGPCVVAATALMATCRAADGAVTAEDVANIVGAVSASRAYHSDAPAQRAAARAALVAGLCRAASRVDPAAAVEVDAAAPFASEAEAAHFLRCSEALVASRRLSADSAAALCACLAAGALPLLSATAERAFGVIARCLAEAPESSTQRATLCACVILAAAARLRARSAAAAMARRNCAGISKAAIDLEVYASDAASLGGDWPDVARRLALDAVTDSAAAAGVACEAAMHVYHQRRRTTAATDDAESAAATGALAAARDLARSLAGLCRATVVRGRLSRPAAASAAVAACCMWFPPSATPQLFPGQETRVRQQLRGLYRIDKPTRDALLDLGLALLDASAEGGGGDEAVRAELERLRKS